MGANHGTFAQGMKQQFGADVRMVEANPKLYAELSQSGTTPTMHYAVVAGNMSTIQFNIAANDEGSSILSLPQESLYGCTLSEVVHVPARTFAALLDEIGWDYVDLVKMDIEGAEVDVLNSVDATLLNRIGQLAVEFHGDSTFRFGLGPQVEQCLKRLQDAGFIIVDFTYPRRIDVLLINTNRIPVSNQDKLHWWMKYTLPKSMRATIRAIVPQGIRQMIRRLRGRQQSA